MCYPPIVQPQTSMKRTGLHNNVVQPFQLFQISLNDSRASVKSVDIIQYKIVYHARNCHANKAPGINIADSDVHRFAAGGMTPAVGTQVTDADHFPAALRLNPGIGCGGVHNAVDEDIVDFGAALIENSYEAAIGCGTDIADDHIIQVVAEAFDVITVFQATGQVAAGDGIILCETGDVFNQNVVTADSEINTIGIFNQNTLRIVWGRGYQTGIRAEINIADSAAAAEDEIHGPPTLVVQLNAGNLKFLHIGKEDQIIDTHVWASVLQLIFLTKTVIGTTVQDCLADTHNADVAVSACQCSAFGCSAMFVCE